MYDGFLSYLQVATGE